MQRIAVEKKEKRNEEDVTRALATRRESADICRVWMFNRLFVVAAPALVVACTIDMYRDLKD